MNRTPVERVGAADLGMGATGAHGGLPQQFGAVLVLDAPPGYDLGTLRRALAAHVVAVPRLRQVLVRPAPGGGGPIWVDDAAFDLAAHVREAPRPGPGEEADLLDLAGRLAVVPLPATRPQWAVTLVTGLPGGRAALVFLFHHVLLDGLGGLAVLGALVDEAGDVPAGAGADFPRPPPTYGRLAADAARTRARALRRLPGAVRGLRRAMRAAGGIGAATAAPCSLLGPTGTRQRLAAVRTDLAALRSAAHRCGGTVNDALLTAVAGGLSALLGHRGERVDTLAVTVIVSARRSATAERLGNEVTPLIVAVPADGEPLERLRRTAGAVARSRGAAEGPPVIGLLGPVFRWLAAVGAYRWWLRRQRRFHTLVSNVRGPDAVLHLAGATVRDVVPFGVGEGGNVRVSFLALSYAGTLTLTAVADADAVPDLDVLAAAVRDQFDALTRPAGSRPAEAVSARPASRG